MTSTPSAGSPYPPLHPARIADLVRRKGGSWTQLTTSAATGSTNHDLAMAVALGSAGSVGGVGGVGGVGEGTVYATEEQTAGRGRLDRGWASPPGAGLLWSVLLDPGPVPPERLGWVPLLMGLSVAEAVRAVTDVPVLLKWPNDLVVDGPDRAGGPGPRKLAGILVERVVGTPTAGVGTSAARALLVAGCGLNVLTAAQDLPVPAATSVALERLALESLAVESLAVESLAVDVSALDVESPGAAGRPVAVDRDDLLAACLVRLQRRFEVWRSAGGDVVRTGLLDDYRGACLTLGRDVRVLLPDGAHLDGVAVDIDVEGRLLVEEAGRRTAVAAGDVVHLR